MTILPNPQKLTKGEGYFYLPYNGKIVMDSSCKNEVFKYAKMLQEQIVESFGFPVVIEKSVKKVKNAINMSLEEGLSSEAYTLTIDTEGVSIGGGDLAGLLYGVQTLRQIIRQEGGRLPVLSIEDYPQIPNRGFYHDVTRGRVPTLDYLKKLADQCSFYKLNQLQLYVEHTFLFEQFHEVWRDDTPLTAEDILWLDDYCKGLHIELVPSIASFGHLYKVLRSKSYAYLCEMEEEEGKDFSFFDRMAHHTVDVTNEESFQMIARMLSDFVELFSSNQVNICADETFDLGKGKSKAKAEEIGHVRLYVDFLKRLCEHVKSLGKRTMFWGDIILAKPELIHELPEDVICLNWDYGTEVQDTNVRKLHELSVKQYLCPGVHGWRHLINHHENAYKNISRFCSFAHKYEANGVLNTDWGDYGHIHHAEFSVIGLIYGAAFSWNSNILEEKEIDRQISELEFTDPSGRFVSIVKKIGKQESLSWDNFVQYSEELRYRVNNLGEEEFFHRMDLSEAKDCNERLDDYSKELYELMIQMDSVGKAKVYPYLVMVKGQQLLNIVGATISQYRFHQPNSVAVNPNRLAADLEMWIYDYKKLWRTISQESELFQIEDLFFWYADFLRKIT